MNAPTKLLISLSLILPTLASAAQDPCAANRKTPQCVQAIKQLHKRTEHGAGQAHAKSAALASHPGAAAASLAQKSGDANESGAQLSDRIHAGEAHPVSTNPERAGRKQGN